MPKGSRGGQRAAGSTQAQPQGWRRQYMRQQAPAAAPAQPTPAPSPQQVAAGNIMPAGGIAFSSFEKMSDDQKADVIKDALKSGTPMFLDDSGMQKFAYFTGMSDKPTVVSESTLNNTPGLGK